MSCWEKSAKTSSPYYSNSEIVCNIPLEVFLSHCEIVNERNIVDNKQLLLEMVSLKVSEQDVHRKIVLLLEH